MNVRVAMMVAVLASSFSLCAKERPEPPVEFVEPLPKYSFPYENGLYATIAGYLNVREVELKDDDSYSLKVPGFERKMPVKAVIHKHNAPLVVILLGINGHTGADFNKLWAAWYAKAGYHVMYFDSTFRPSFVETSGHGVTGNLWAESERIARIIQAFLNEKDVRGKVSKVGIVGMSYGGTQALILGRMAKEGTLPFELAGIQAYSPPLRMEWTARELDRWYDQERSKYTLAELQSKMGSYDPSKDRNGNVPFSDSMMKAGIAASFRLGLPDVIVRNDAYYDLNILRRGDMIDDSFVRQQEAEAWGYTQFAFDMALPYWQTRLGDSAIQRLIRDTYLSELLRHQPDYSQTILAADDPLNPPGEAEQLRLPGLTVLPHGGHLGYIAQPWTKAKLKTLFSAGPSHLTYTRRAR